MCLFDWESEREEIRKESLRTHERLHRLFKEDRLSFERERKRMINEVISGTYNNKIRTTLVNLQKSWDNKMRKAGSEHNRLVLAKFLLSKHVNEIWNPSLQAFKRGLDHT
jgi:hypothetical protein